MTFTEEELQSLAVWILANLIGDPANALPDDPVMEAWDATNDAGHGVGLRFRSGRVLTLRLSDGGRR
jgi:hypothetical protein